MKELLNDIGFVLRNAGREIGNERRIQLEIACDLMRQYQVAVEGHLEIRCSYCGRFECSH